MDVIDRAIELMADEKFTTALANEQAYDYERHHGHTPHRSYVRWLWSYSHQEARLERATAEGKAVQVFGGYRHDNEPITEQDFDDAMDRYYGF